MFRREKCWRGSTDMCGDGDHFHLHNSTRVFVRQRFFLEQRMRKYLRGDDRSRGLDFAGGRQLNSTKSFGLYAIPQYAPYRRPRMP